MKSRTFFVSLITASLVIPAAGRDIALDPAALQAHNVKLDSVTYKGRKAVRVADAGQSGLPDGARVAVVTGTEFMDGTIEVDLAGDTEPGATPEFRGFTGIVFRASDDGSKYECFYLRPKNGRSEDQLQRNHTAQYISIPEFGWKKLREAFPGKYETYVDLAPGEWTHFKIEAHGDKAKLFINQMSQPVLVVNDLKHGSSKGAVGLWVDPKTVAHFGNLRIVE